MTAENFVPDLTWRFRGRFVAESPHGTLEEVGGWWESPWRDKSLPALRDLLTGRFARGLRALPPIGGARLLARTLTTRVPTRSTTYWVAALLTKERARVIADGRGPHGATATAAALLLIARSTWGRE